MNKDDITYSVIGVVIGLVLGFLVANRVAPAPAAGGPAAATSAPQASVNSSSSQQDLPPGHPPVDPSQPTQAGPLPAGAESAARDSAARDSAASAPSRPAAPPSTEVAELPSLDPLPASSKEERTEKKYKNIQILKGLPAERLTSVMFAFKASLGVDCTHCHIKDQWEKDDKPTKQMARKMITLTREANAKLGGSARVTCFTCHRGQTRPPA
jgi:photosynthetic reaction center cytochrome c subunit